MVVNIQRFSLHDGPGIRTTVFFKGCPLSCQWCHNPEGQAYQAQLLHYPNRCLSCGQCIAHCSAQAITWDSKNISIDRSLCRACGACLLECPANAREIAGKEYSVSELVDIIKRDQILYDDTGGGVTLSGGECLTQPVSVLKALCQRLHRLGIDIVVDTCGYTTKENLSALMPYVSTFLYDVKLIDDDKHRRFVGVSNQVILDNLKFLSQEGATINLRLPMIEGVNAEREHMERLSAWLLDNKIRIQSINLLPYHETGSSKYDYLGRVYLGESMTRPSQEKLNQLKDLLESKGFTQTKIGG